MKQIIKCVLWLLLDFAIQMAVSIAVVVFCVLSGMTDEITPAFANGILLVMVLIANVIFVGVVLAVFAARKKSLLPESDRDGWLSKCILPFGMALLYSLGFSLLCSGSSADIDNSVAYMSGALPWLGQLLKVLNLLVLAPAAEELLCRRIMLDGLRERFSARTAVLLSSAIFGAMHIFAGGASLGIGAAVMGLMLALVYVKTGSLRASVAVHAVANLPDFILPLFDVPDGAVRTVAAVVMLVAAAVCLLLWLRGDIHSSENN